MSQSNTGQAELLITGKFLVTQDSDRSVLQEGGVAIQGDTILETGKARDLEKKYPGAERIAEEHGLIMPGLVNVHTHAAMVLFRGLADDIPLMTWLNEHIFPAERKLTGEVVYHATRLSLAEMIKSGTTSYCDMYLFAKEVARATAEAGVRGWIGEVLYDFPSPNYGELSSGVRYMEEMFEHYRGHSLVKPIVEPHAVYTCSPALLKDLKKLAEKHETLYAIHLSENREEVSGTEEKYGCTPVSHLEKLGLLDAQVVADHCVVLTPEEIELLARRGVKVAHCPESNLKLASGVAPVPALLSAGVVVGLGTDGCASNNDVDLFGEMKTAAQLHKGHTLDPTVMDAGSVLDLATIGGARVLGAGQSLGSLETGKKADLIVLDLNQPHLTPLHQVASQLVYAARGSDVIHSVINGRVVMRHRTLTTLDEAAILERLRAEAEK